MADSTLDITGEQPPNTNKGHGTEALGPSDSSDSGSDVVGGPGLGKDVGLGLDRGTTEDPSAAGTRTAGPDLGDGNLDSDSDASGTGERASAGRDNARSDRDISVDRIVSTGDEAGRDLDEVDLGDLGDLDMGTDPGADQEADADLQGEAGVAGDSDSQREADADFEPGTRKQQR
jgi:hypothetical protein